MNWKTTTLGVLTIVGAIAHAGVQYFSGQQIDFTVLMAGIAAGWGLFHAADASKV